MDEPATAVEVLLAQARVLRQEANALVSALQDACRTGNMNQYIALKVRSGELLREAQTLEERVIVSQALQHEQHRWGDSS
jgi:hypothetical protein